MSFSLIPRYSYKKVTDISTDFFRDLGVELLLLDLDNTIVPYEKKTLPDEVASWIQEIKKAGIKICLLSNNRFSSRVGRFADDMEAEYICPAKKPSAVSVHRALALHDMRPEKAALVGDQIFADVIAANSAGVVSIAVRPMDMKNPIWAVRYGMEAPFRALCKNKMRDGKK